MGWWNKLFGTLHDAAHDGDLECLRNKIKESKPGDLDSMDCNGYPAIYYAFFNKRFNCVILLLISGANVNVPIKNRYVKGMILQRYIEKTPTNISVLRLLISYGAIINDVAFKEREAEEYARALKVKVDNRDELLREVEQRLSTGHVDFLREANAYKSVGDFWYELFIEESQYEHCNTVFRDHYWNKAVEYYQKTGQLLMKLPRGSAELAKYQPLFERTISECSTREAKLVPVFSNYAVHLQQTASDEQIHCLDVSTSTVGVNRELRQRVVKVPN